MLRLSDVITYALEQTSHWLRAPAHELCTSPARSRHARGHLLQPTEALVKLLEGLIAFLG
jgi:hypothetical protein